MAIGEIEEDSRGVGGLVGLRGLSSSLSNLVSRSLSVFSSRLDFARITGADLGTSYLGLRDVNQSLGYIPPKDLTVHHYRLRYERGGIAQTIVEIFPAMTWAGELEIYEDPDPEVETEFERQIKQLFDRDRLSVETKLEQVDILAGIGCYGGLLIGAPGEMSTPLGNLSGPESILYLTPLAEDQCVIDTRVDNPTDRRFNLPEYYKVTLDTKRNTKARVHYSRILHVADGALSSDLYGKPRLRSVYNYLDDLIKVVGGGAEAAWKRQDPGMQVDVPAFDENGKPIKMGENQEAEFQEEVDNYTHGLSRVLKTRGGVKISLLNSNVSNFGPNSHAILELISGTTGIPVRVLLGSERGELASTQDRLTLEERVKKRRERYAVPLIRQFINLLIDHGGLVKPANGEYFVEWNEAAKTTPDQQAINLERLARANKTQVDAGDSLVITSEEMRDGILGLEPLEDTSDEDEEDGDDGSILGDDEDDEDEDIDIRVNIDTLAAANPNEPEWKAIHRVADKNRRLLARDIRETWLDSARSIDEIALESAIHTGDTTRVNSILSQLVNDTLSPMLITVGQSRLQQTLIQAGQAALKASRARGSWYVKSSRSKTSNLDSASASTVFEMVFDAVNPRAVVYALNRSSQLVTQITPDTLAGLQSIVSLGTETGIPPRKQVQQVRELVGLRDDQVRAMYNLRRRLEEAKGGSVVKAGKVKIKIPRKGLSGEQIEAQVDKYGKRLLNQRSLLISRTETMRSANEGQKELWKQAQDNGLLPDDIKREWIVTDDSRLREEHREMEGQRVGVNEPFSPIAEPGSEPACRCSQGLVED